MNQQLELLDVHNRRLGVLRKKAAKVGIQMDASVEMEIEDISNTVLGLESELKRTLQHLKLQQAIKGISVDPSILIEIEDIEKYFLGKGETV